MIDLPGWGRRIVKAQFLTAGLTTPHPKIEKEEGEIFVGIQERVIHAITSLL